jgi:hypothetical protein
MAVPNPFTERGRITDPGRFAGRWSELSLIFDWLEAGRPVLVAGAPGVGKSSLLTHITQAAAINLDLPDIFGFYLDLREAEDSAEVFKAVVEALESRGNTLAALEVALVAVENPVLLCLDNAHVAIAAGWGEQLLDTLGRLARSRRLMLVAAVQGAPPQLSERFSTLTLGAFAAPEIRLLAEAYLDPTDIVFTPADLRELARVSAAHPAYLQRAAYHLFQSKLFPDLNWRAAYFAEAREHPIPGAPLPPAVFQGDQGERVAESIYGEETDAARRAAGPPPMPELELDTALFALLPFVGGGLLYLVIGSLVGAVLVVVIGLFLVVAWSRRARRLANQKHEHKQ